MPGLPHVQQLSSMVEGMGEVVERVDYEKLVHQWLANAAWTKWVMKNVYSPADQNNSGTARCLISLDLTCSRYPESFS